MTREEHQMEHRRLGRSSLDVTAIGLGCMSMSGAYGPGDDAQSIAVVHRALDLGINFLDSSDMYGWGHNEELLGKALRGKRDRVVLATKFGNLRKPDGTPGVNGRPEYVPQACDASLKRLGVEVIDLYYQHRVDPAVPIEETVGAMSRLVEEGKVRFLGLSEAAPATVRRAHAVHPIAALQIEYSLLYRVEAEETLPTLRELGISLVAYSPLGRSLLTGQVHKVADIPEDDRRRAHPRFQEQNLQRNVEFVRKIEQMARDKGCTPGQLALAWLLARGRDIVPIPGTKRRDRLEENVGALDVRLTAEEAARLADAVPVGAAAGLRYPEPLMKGVYL
jgi:aryl-alcohol dehydrogenase-like predicted oxidoreductase